MFSNRSRGGESVAFIFLVDKKEKEKERQKSTPPRDSNFFSFLEPRILVRVIFFDQARVNP